MVQNDTRIQNDVKAFYDKVGWKVESDGFYQNAVYEDLRPVSQEYIHRCHLRVNRHLFQGGRFLLDAGCGPIQWPEYLTYSESYEKRVCVDLSIEGLKEARKRIGNHGYFVVADVVHLPFRNEVFDGIVSLHTIHHVPANEKEQAHLELHRTLKCDRSAVVVNGWGVAPLMNRWTWLVKLSDRIVFFDLKKMIEKMKKMRKSHQAAANKMVEEPVMAGVAPRGTFTTRDSYETFLESYRSKFRFEIFPWRSVSVRFLRAIIHPGLFGKSILRYIYRCEEKHSDKYGREGQYPMIVIYK